MHILIISACVCPVVFASSVSACFSFAVNHTVVFCKVAPLHKSRPSAHPLDANLLTPVTLRLWPSVQYRRGVAVVRRIGEGRRP
jgi:hypothetical protein